VRETTSVTRTVRWGTPAALLLAGLVLVFAFGSRETEAAGYTLLGSSALLVLSIVIFRAGLASNEDRDREEAARVFFDEHGRWPRRAELDERFGSGGPGKDPMR
jgi:glucose uptake protein GlcU